MATENDHEHYYYNMATDNDTEYWYIQLLYNPNDFTGHLVIGSDMKNDTYMLEILSV